MSVILGTYSIPCSVTGFAVIVNHMRALWRLESTATTNVHTKLYEVSIYTYTSVASRVAIPVSAEFPRERAKKFTLRGACKWHFRGISAGFPRDFRAVVIRALLVAGRGNHV
jgi:hypothetical protein